MRRHLALTLVSILALSTSAAAQTAGGLDFLAGLPDFRDVRSMLPVYLNRLGNGLLDEREKTLAAALSGNNAGGQLAQRRNYIREQMLRALGGLPERTPLNARVVSTLDRDGYRIEKIIFESQPRFFVTANLYVPKNGRAPYPAVLFPLGHEVGGKANPTWQQILVTLARRGFVSLAWDPLGQGERVQFYDADLKDSKLGRNRSTTEHSMLGVQTLLLGDNVARYTVWDGIRALDYLLSRPEVDITRVAVTGNSGGGTHTAYLAALDDRIHVAAPSCYLTSWRRLLETIGPQDAEQSLPPWLGARLDHADFVHAFAPKPYLILSAIRDFFSITGARATYEEARRAYSALGAEEKLGMVEADDGHGYTKPRRQAFYRWAGRWLKGAEDNEPEVDVAPETEETLRCTDTGHVAASLGGETVFSLNRKRFEQVRPARPPSAGEVRLRARELSGFAPAKGALKVHPFGSIARKGYRIEKLIYESEPGILVPALLFVPDGVQGRAPAIVYAHGRGKAAGAAEIEQIVQAGFVVLAPDLRGMGETAVGESDGQRYSGYFGDYSNIMKALLAGKTLAGMRAQDIARGLDLLEARPEVDAKRISAFARGAAAPALLYAAALDGRIQKVALEGGLASYESVVSERIHQGVFENIVPGALKFFDLPDLAASLAPRPVWIVNAADPRGYRAAPGDVRSQYARALAAYRAAGAESALHIAERNDDQPLKAAYAGLLDSR